MGYDITAELVLQKDRLDLHIMCPSPPISIECPGEPFTFHFDTTHCGSKRKRSCAGQDNGGAGSIVLTNLRQHRNAVFLALKANKLSLQNICFSAPHPHFECASNSGALFDDVFSNSDTAITVTVTAYSFVKLQLELRYKPDCSLTRPLSPKTRFRQFAHHNESMVPCGMVQEENCGVELAILKRVNGGYIAQQSRRTKLLFGDSEAENTAPADLPTCTLITPSVQQAKSTAHSSWASRARCRILPVFSITFLLLKTWVNQ